MEVKMKTTICHKYFCKEIIVLLIMGGLLVACQTIIPNNKTAKSTATVQLSTNASQTYITASSISELTNKSAIVIIGKVTKTDNIINMARDGNDLTKPDPNLFGIGQVYELNISEYLKSDPSASGASTIKVVQPQGKIVLPSQQPPSANDIEKARSSEKYIPLIVGNEYLLFLVPLKGFPEKDLYFTGVAFPWQFQLANNCAYPESPWEGASAYFQPQPITIYTDQVSAAINNNASPTESFVYPPPSDEQSKSICPPINSMITPYP
jgi:hypothetical protein